VAQLVVKTLLIAIRDLLVGSPTELHEGPSPDPMVFSS